MIEAGGVCCDAVVPTLTTVALLRRSGGAAGLETALIVRKPGGSAG